MTGELDQAAPREGASDVFISYAREDRRFVQQLHDALAGAGRRSWVDWEGIPASAKWMAEVRAAIDDSDCFCFVVSPDSVESPVCREEAAHAASSNKRILPLVHRQVDDGLVPETVAAHNWISFSDGASFDDAFAQLVVALETEPEHLRAHTRLLVRAKEWEGSQRDRSLLLRGQDLTNAEAWLASAQGKDPAPTQLHTSFVLASRKAASRRQRTTIAAVLFTLMISLGLSAVAVVQRGQAQDAQTKAEDQAALATSRLLASQAITDMDDRLDRALLLAVQAFKTEPTLEARGALLSTLQALPSLERILKPFQSAGFGTFALAYSPDGATLATGEDDSLTLWNTTTGTTLMAPFQVPGSFMHSLAFSPDGTIVASGANDGSVALWDAETGSALGEPDVGTQDVFSVAFSPDGSLLATGLDGGSVVLSDAATGELIGEPLGSRLDWVEDVAFSPDGRWLAAAGQGGLVLWRLDSPSGLTPTDVIRGDEISTIAFSPDGMSLASSRSKGGLTLWHVGSQQLVRERQWEGGFVVDVAFSPDGTLVATTGTDGLRLWGAATSAPASTPVLAQSERTSSIAFNPDGGVLAEAAADGSVLLWNLEGRTPLGRSLPTTQRYVNSIAFSSDGREFASGGDGSVLWDTIGWVPQDLALRRPDRHAGDVASSPDGSVLASAGNAHPDEGNWRRLLVSVYLWDTATGVALGEPIEVRGGSVYGLDFSPDGQVLAAGTGEDGTIELWNVGPEPSRRGVLEGEQGSVTGVEFNPDGSILASGGKGGTVLWDMTTMEVMARLRSNRAAVNGLAFSPDGRVLAAGDDGGSIVLWDVHDRRPIGAPLVGDGLPIYSLASNADGAILAAAGEGGDVALWDVATQRLLAQLHGVDPYVNDVAFDPRGGALVVAGGGRYSLTLWDMDPSSWIQEACAVADRDLTTQEWATFVGTDVPYRHTCFSPDSGGSR